MRNKNKLIVKDPFDSCSEWTDDVSTSSDDSELDTVRKEDKIESIYLNTRKRKRDLPIRNTRKSAKDFVNSRKTHQKSVFQSVDTFENPTSYVEAARNFSPPLGEGFVLPEDLKRVIRKELEPGIHEQRTRTLRKYAELATSKDLITRNKELHDKVPQKSKKLVSKFNLALIERLLHDAEMRGGKFLEYLVNGFPVVGIIDEPGVFDRTNRDQPEIRRASLMAQKEKLIRDCEKLNHPTELDELNWEACLAQVEVGALESPILLEVLVALGTDFIPTRRFGLLQNDGNGGLKHRPVDNCKRSGLNLACVVRTPAQLSRVEDLTKMMEFMFSEIENKEHLKNVKVKMVKGDHKKAYNQIPMREGHKKYLHIVARCPSDGKLYTFRPISMIFGSAAAVINYNMCALMVTRLCRKILNLPILSYFDDFISLTIEENNISTKERLSTTDLFNDFNALLGFEVHLGKSEYGMCLPFLGILFDISSQENDWEPTVCVVTIDEHRKEKLCKLIKATVEENKLSATDAAALAGKLSFAQSVLFGRLGRAYLKPIYSRSGSPLSMKPLKLNEELRQALDWFLNALNEAFRHTVALESSQKRDNNPLHLFSDASNEGIGFVLFSPEENHCVTGSRSIQVSNTQVNIISTREILAAQQALESNKGVLKNRRVVFWIDNTSAISALQRGYSSGDPFNQITKSFWCTIAKQNIWPWFEFIPSKGNPADCVSRGIPLRLDCDTQISSPFWEIQLQFFTEASERAISRTVLIF